jgi:hypothetical protein
VERSAQHELPNQADCHANLLRPCLYSHLGLHILVDSVTPLNKLRQGTRWANGPQTKQCKKSGLYITSITTPGYVLT